MTDSEIKQIMDTQISPGQQLSAARVWPPPPRYQQQTVPVRGMSPGHVFVFYVVRLGVAGAAIGAILAGGLILVIDPFAGIIAGAVGASFGIFVGFAAGGLLGMIAAGLYASGVSSNTVGRVICWLCPALSVLAAIAYVFMSHRLAFSPDRTVLEDLAVTIFLFWQASRIIAREFVGRF